VGVIGVNCHDSPSPKFHDLEALTADFFHKHWDKTKAQAPTWKNGWDWNSSVPNHSKSGVYALFDSKSTVIYIGVGISTGRKYSEHGISRRLLAHVIKRNSDKTGNQFVVKSKWETENEKVVDIGSVGFEREDDYLALALEAFLIKKLAPDKNRRK
jgi:hypothetical protein